VRSPSPPAAGLGDSAPATCSRRAIGFPLGMIAVESFEDLPHDVAFDERYSRGELLGAGGAGEVFVLADSWIGRDVALKVLREVPEEGETSPTAERFFREARLQGQLEHPSIVPVYDCGRMADGRGYFTMKRVRGVTLEELLSDHPDSAPLSGLVPVSRRRLLEAFVRICLAVDFAHSFGIVHRDLKPGNIMLGDFGEVYVLDWGIAKVIAEGDPDGSLGRTPGPLPQVSETAVGSWMGTPGYMAPEQLDGGDVDCRADVYALGAILFEVLTRQPLHPRKRPVEAVASTRRGAVARPSVRCPQLEIAPEFDAILSRATAFAPSERFATARDLAERVERFLDGDRDLTRRRELANDHVDEAREALSQLGRKNVDETATQRELLRNIGRALALDPENTEALQLLRDAMLHEPATDPPEVRRELRRNNLNMRREGVRILFWRSVMWACCLPFTVWAGFTHPVVAWSVVGGVALSVVVLSLLRRIRRVTDGVGLLLLALTSAVFGSMSVMFGPFIVVPALVSINMAFFIFHSQPRHRPIIVLAGVLTVMGPFVAELLGIVPPSYEFVAGAIRILPRVMAFNSQSVVLTILAAFHVAIVLAASFISIRIRDELLAAERRVSLLGWRMGQLATDLRAVRPRGLSELSPKG
jgi:serine/threonine protein kinase